MTVGRTDARIPRNTTPPQPPHMHSNANVSITGDMEPKVIKEESVEKDTSYVDSSAPVRVKAKLREFIAENFTARGAFCLHSHRSSSDSANVRCPHMQAPSLQFIFTRLHPRRYPRRYAFRVDLVERTEVVHANTRPFKNMTEIQFVGFETSTLRI